MSISDLISYMYMYNSYDKAILTEWFSDLAYWAKPAFQKWMKHTKLSSYCIPPRFNCAS